MNVNVWLVIGLALLPGLGNFAGGLIGEFTPVSKRALNFALHAAAGLIVAIVAVEVMPQALEAAEAWILAIAFTAGGLTYIGVNAGVERWQRKKESGPGTGAWMVYIAVVTDLVGDGLLIGTGSAVSMGVAVVLALGQVLADLPEGFAVIANFKEKKVKRRKRLLLGASFIVPVVGAAVIAYYALRGQSEVVKMSALVFVAGLYLLAAVEDMLAEAHESAKDQRWSAASFIGGFALFLVVTGLLG